MKKPTRSLFMIFAAVVLSIGLTACANESREHEEGSGEASHAEAASESSAAESGGEHAMAEAASESGEGGEYGEHSEARESSGEHGGEHAEGGEHGEGGESHGEGGEEGEESGVYIGVGETWDVVRRGARLVLAFERASNAFVGTVTNTTSETLCAVRVEVHLSTGTELGPTERTDVRAGQSTAVRLPTAGEAFDTWTAHPELSACSGG